MPTQRPPTSSSTSFPGFDVPRQNYFKMPNNWTDITAEIGSIAELKVVEYVLRHTWGYQEYKIGKQISIDEFMSGRKTKSGRRMDKGTGLVKTSVITGLKAAVERGLLEETVDASDLGRVKKFYRLRMLEDTEGNAVLSDVLPENEGSLEETEVAKKGETGGYQNLDAGVQILYPPVQISNPRGKKLVHRTEKETLERNQQERQEKNNNNIARANGSAPPAKAKTVVVASLVQEGVGQSVAQELAGSFDADFIAGKIEYLHFLRAERPDDVKKPAAWLRRAIERDFAAPDGFQTAAQREQVTRDENERMRALHEVQNERLAREREAEKEREAQRAATQARLQQEYATEPEDTKLWQRLVDELQDAGDPALYGLLAHTQLLTNQDGTLTVGVPAGIHARQLSADRIMFHLKRILKRLSKEDYELHFMLVEGLG